jgi:hypothetical protein
VRSPWGNSYATCDDANYHAGVYQGIAPSVKAERVAEMKKAWADDGCHPSQVQRRKDESWPKRWALMNAATGSGLGVGQYRHGASHRELQPGQGARERGHLAGFCVERAIFFFPRVMIRKQRNFPLLGN